MARSAPTGTAGSAVSAVRLFGHPLHPMLTAFPVAFWVGASFWDLVGIVATGEHWPRLAAWTLAAGVAMAVPALATGLLDFGRLPRVPRVERLAFLHMMAMVSAWCAESASLLMRRAWLLEATPATSTPISAVVLAATGVALTLWGGWLGGELVFGHAIAVEAGPEKPKEVVPGQEGPSTGTDLLVER
ncbi:MAG: DUF2231 domain-containing protein [Thermoanaerobaculia bacterium]|nr:DUF2231 domain-containing protein [Thermoanaerobaculia bacterium]